MKYTLPDEQEIASLLRALQPTIGDDYRATDDPSDDTPGMCVTIGASPDGSWSYQTGDNSYSGGAYGHPAWGVVYLYRDSDPAELAGDALDQIADALQYCTERE
jgi:hypothetical protein